MAGIRTSAVAACIAVALQGCAVVGPPETEGLDAQPTPVEYFEKGLGLAQVGADDRAIVAYDKAIELDPAYQDAYYARGLARFELGELTAAIADFDRAIALNPKDADAFNRRGRTRKAMGDYAAAIADYDEAIRLDTDLAQAFNNRANAYYHQRLYDQAIKDYDEAIRLRPNYAFAHNNRGLSLFRMGEYARAIDDYSEAIRIYPEYVSAWGNRCRLRGLMGRPDKALEDCDKSLQIGAGNPRNHARRAFALWQLGRLDEAKAALGDAHALYPSGEFEPTARLADFPVTLVQGLLTLRRYKPGDVDGKLGPSTMAAIKAFERDSGIAETGEPSDRLIRALKAALTS